jgi:hypothetical protein
MCNLTVVKHKHAAHIIETLEGGPEHKQHQEDSKGEAEGQEEDQYPSLSDTLG